MLVLDWNRETKNRSLGDGRQQLLQRLRDGHVLMIATLVAIQLFALDDLEARAIAGGLARLRLVLGVVHRLPREPVGAPLRVRGLDRPLAEREAPAEGAIERGHLGGRDRARVSRDRLPHEQRARVAPRGVERRREQRDQRQRAGARRLVARRPQFGGDRARRQHHGDRDRRDGRRGGEERDQYLRTACTFSPSSFVRPFKPTSSIRNARPCTWPPSFLTRSVVARAVPPVASRSSTISTRCPALTASSCISSASVPYSSA